MAPEENFEDLDAPEVSHIQMQSSRLNTPLISPVPLELLRTVESPHSVPQDLLRAVDSLTTAPSADIPEVQEQQVKEEFMQGSSIEEPVIVKIYLCTRSHSTRPVMKDFRTPRIWMAMYFHLKGGIQGMNDPTLQNVIFREAEKNMKNDYQFKNVNKIPIQAKLVNRMIWIMGTDDDAGQGPRSGIIRNTFNYRLFPNVFPRASKFIGNQKVYKYYLSYYLEINPHPVEGLLPDHLLVKMELADELMSLVNAGNPLPNLVKKIKDFASGSLSEALEVPRQVPTAEALLALRMQSRKEEQRSNSMSDQSKTKPGSPKPTPGSSKEKVMDFREKPLPSKRKQISPPTSDNSATSDKTPPSQKSNTKSKKRTKKSSTSTSTSLINLKPDEQLPKDSKVTHSSSEEEEQDHPQRGKQLRGRGKGHHKGHRNSSPGGMMTGPNTNWWNAPFPSRQGMFGPMDPMFQAYFMQPNFNPARQNWKSASKKKRGGKGH